MHFYNPETYSTYQTLRDLADEEAKRLADRAEDFNRSYRTITTEQANDIARAIAALNSVIGRVEQ